MADPVRIRLGVLARPHSLRGGLRCTLDTQAPPRIEVPCDVLVGYTESFSRPRRLLSYEPGRDEMVCYFEGVTDRDAAQELVDQALYVPKESVRYDDPFADPGFVGFGVVDEEGNDLGTVSGLMLTNAHYVWQVEEGGREWMVPAIDEFVVGIDEEAETIVVRLIPGLYDEEASEEVEPAEEDAEAEDGD